MIYEYFRVTGACEAVLDCSDLVSIIHMATIFRILIPDGMKLYHQSVKFPTTVFWKVCL